VELVSSSDRNKQIERLILLSKNSGSAAAFHIGYAATSYLQTATFAVGTAFSDEATKIATGFSDSATREMIVNDFKVASQAGLPPFSLPAPSGNIWKNLGGVFNALIDYIVSAQRHFEKER